MMIGTAAWGMREMRLEDQVALTRKLGLDLMELSIAGYDKDFLQLDARSAEIQSVKKIFQNQGVLLRCACTGNDFTEADPVSITASVEKVERVIDIASNLGITWLRIFAGFSSDSVVYGARFDAMTNGLSRVVAHARERGVILVMETHGGVAQNGNALVHFNSATTRIDLVANILDRVPGLMLNYDPANLAAVGSVDPIQFYDCFRDRIAYVHLKDFKKVPGGVVPAACGEGLLDWPRLAKTLSRYAGPVLMEYEIPADIEDGFRRSLDCLVKLGL